MNGLSFVVAIGKYGGFHAKADGLGLRLCLGWIAFTLYFMDIEAAIEKMLEEMEKMAKDLKAKEQGHRSKFNEMIHGGGK